MRKCSYCNGMTPRETLNIPDSCYCQNCGSYLGKESEKIIKTDNPSRRDSI